MKKHVLYVIIHDGKGHPLYFQTFQGYADIGKHALNMVTKLNEMLDNPSSHLQVNRIIVFDAGGNGVQTLRGFYDSVEYYITILDEKHRKICEMITNLKLILEVFERM
jgi:hypothetical protein